MPLFVYDKYNMIINDFNSIAKRVKEIQQQENSPVEEEEDKELAAEELYYCCYPQSPWD